MRDEDPIRDRIGHLAEVQETAPACPEDWGALRVTPRTVELWSEAEDRIPSGGCSSAARTAVGARPCWRPETALPLGLYRGGGCR